MLFPYLSNSLYPVTVFTKQDPDVESESAPQHKRQNGARNLECHIMTESPYLQGATTAFDAYPHETSFCEKRVFSRDDGTGKTIENYRSSPKQFRHFQQSPDILSAKVCVELDLVASSVRAIKPDASPSIEKTIPLPAITITPDEAIAKLLDDPSTKSDSIERQQPEGREKIPAGELPLQIPTTSEALEDDDKLEGMLDRISHDLDYLLNRSGEIDPEPSVPIPSMGSFRKISKPPAPSIIEEIREETEDEVKIPEAITEVLRTNC